MSDLHDRLRIAHAPGGGASLARLYTDTAERLDDTDATCFFLSHAYVFALEAGDPVVPELHARPAAHGRV